MAWKAIGEKLPVMPRTRGGHTQPIQREVVVQAAVERPYIGQINKKSFVDSAVTWQLGKDLRQYIFGHWPIFDTMPHDERELLWELFQTQYSWPNKETARVIATWRATMTRRHTAILGYERSKALQRAGSTELSDTRGHGPNWITLEVWDGLLVQWLSPEWQEKSKKGKQNRQTLKSRTIAKHSGGSILFATHAVRMEKELGRPPSKTELFMRTHQKKGSSSFIDEKSRLVVKTYKILLQEKYGSSASEQLPFDQALWVEATGGPMKGKVYRFGGRAHGLGPSSSRTSAQHTSQHSQCVTQDQLTETVERIVRNMIRTPESEEEEGEEGEEEEEDDE